MTIVIFGIGHYHWLLCAPLVFFIFEGGGGVLATKNLRLLPYYCLVFTPVEMEWEQGLPILFYFISLGILVIFFGYFKLLRRLFIIFGYF